MILASTSAYYNVAFYPLYGIGLTTLVFYTIALIAFQDKVNKNNIFNNILSFMFF